MSLPGLQLDSPSEPTVAASAFHDLGSNTEWRFEVAFGTNIEVKVCSLCWGFPPKLCGSLIFALSLFQEMQNSLGLNSLKNNHTSSLEPRQRYIPGMAVELRLLVSARWSTWPKKLQ